ncbi:HAD family hydrolase [Halapricum hydrolyticum]|uniref:HAD family hydrolase n=1 Tax=Halapricum hydrolyticum TaxID=2979991 RepID=A0AAE3IDQ9_9EURY|nr:HAD family hydrolase [Halapricum hydrolyticum]MCU4717441.1 HAD family hydrolase [Halapricum hydrolyticum]MCU4726605.1 HAD family hydrolase [Halapricum hydrolyticum]
MTTAIFFDCDGTLVRFERSYADLLRDVFESELGRTSDSLLGAYDEAFTAAFEALEPEPVRRGMEAVVAASDAEGDPDAMAAALQAAEHEHTTVPDGAYESLEVLGESDRLGVLTNGVGDWQREKLAAHDLLPYFETVVSSYDVGAHKPDPAPFEEARERIDAEEYVMVGDSDSDVEGARNAGFVPVRVEEKEDAPEFWATLRALV